jgi:hypothetical protein
VCRLRLVVRGLANVRNIARDGRNGNTFAEPCTGVLEQVPDHQIHGQRALLDEQHGAQLVGPHFAGRRQVVCRHRHRAQRAAQIVAQDGQERIPRTRHLVRVARDRFRQCLVDCLVEPGHFGQHRVLLHGPVLAPQLENAGPQCAVLRGQLAQVEAHDVPERAVGGGGCFLALQIRRPPFRLVGLLPVRLGVLEIARHRLQYFLRVIAQRQRRRRLSGGLQRERECLPFGQDRIKIFIDEPGKRHVLCAVSSR